jgi:L-aminopeptidase/D-esterase-like protein
LSSAVAGRLPAGVRAGHFSDPVRATGCTVFLFEPEARGAMHRFGPATATRHLDAFDAPGPERPIHGLVLTGGSAFGLACSNGAMDVLVERGVGVPTRGGLVPRVPAAVINDLPIGPRAWPSIDDTAAAARLASDELPAEGSVGVGTGASVGKALGPEHACKGGFGVATGHLDDVFVGAFVVTNAFGDVVHPDTRRVVAGCHEGREGTARWLGPDAYGVLGAGRLRPDADAPAPAPSDEATTLALILTDAAFTGRELAYVAQVASQAYARTVSPAATPFDGDLVFAVSCGTRRADLSAVALGAEGLLEQAILRSVHFATGLAGLPSAREIGLA